MQLTKQQKIGGVVLALAIGAFVADRWVSGQEDAVSLVAPEAVARHAAVAARLLPVSSVQTVAATPGVTGAGSVADLAARFEATRADISATDPSFDLEKVRDAFLPSASLAGTRQRGETTPEPQDAAKAFAERRKLAAVVRRQSGRGVAIFEDKSPLPGQAKSAQATLAVGQSLDGFVLVAVKDRSAILRRGAERLEMRLSDDTAHATIAPSVTSENVATIDAQK